MSDEDWNDDKFPELDEIYRKERNYIIDFNTSNSRLKDNMVSPYLIFIKNVMKSKYFRSRVFDMNVLGNLSSKTLQNIFDLMVDCANELFIKMINILGRVDKTILLDMAAACLAISIKLYGAHDWIWDRNVVTTLIKCAGREYSIDLDYRLINIMMKDILMKTDWKGCKAFYIEKDYNRYFEDTKESELDEHDYKEMVKRGRGMVASIGDIDVELMKHDGEFVLKYGSDYYNNEAARYLQFKDMNVVVSEELVEKMAEWREDTKEEAFGWLRDRVMKRGFGITPASFKYKSSLTYLGRKRRSPVETGRKSRSRKTSASRKKSGKGSVYIYL